MTKFETPKAFQANPSPLKKRIFLGAAIAGVAAVVWALLTRGKTDYGAYAFAGGITAVIFSLRFYFMQVKNGPAELTFASEGITLANKVCRQTVPWVELKCIRYMVSRGGHYWEIHSRAHTPTLDFYLDGLTPQQQEDLRETISSLELPDVKIIPFYNPFEKAA